MRPTLRCVLLFAAGIPVALLATVVSHGLWSLWASCFALSVLLCAFDAVYGVARRRLRVDVAAPETLYIGDRDSLSVTMAVADRSPPGIEVPVAELFAA